MKVYRIRHKQTGLFYQPVKGGYGNKTNLGKNGKVYVARKPRLDDIGTLSVGNKQKEIFNFEVNQWGNLVTKDSDWEVIEYELSEGVVIG